MVDFATAFDMSKRRKTNEKGDHVRVAHTTIQETAKKLPIWPFAEEIRTALRHPDQNNVLILSAETGSGKSTQVPQMLMREEWCRRMTREVTLFDAPTSTPTPIPKSTQTPPNTRTKTVSVGGMIAITQPRRVAATTLARRVSRETTSTSTIDFDSGLVGYSVRFEHRIPKKTCKIKFLTEGMLLQELLRDPDLKQYSAVIVDEVHERSVDADLLLGFLKGIVEGKCEGRGGVPLKVVVMSATANVEKLENFFLEGRDRDIETHIEAGDEGTNGDSGRKKKNQRKKEDRPPGTAASAIVRREPCSLPPPTCLSIPGRLYPVDIIHEKEPVADLQEAVVNKVMKIHREEKWPGDVLLFLTGQEEIEAAQRLLKDKEADLPSNVPKMQVVMLYGSMPIDQQQQAFEPVREKFTRKIVLATNIAETSVTVPGVRYVVDCGKAKIKKFRFRLGIDSLFAESISKSSAIQRAGRAGREAAGKCYRLYTQDWYDNKTADADVPEFLRVDTLGAVLTMKAHGINDVFSFPLMDKPASEALEKAIIHLLILGAIDGNDGSITPTGRQMALFPVAAPFGRVLIAASEPRYDCLLEAIDVISCIAAGEDVFYHIHSEDVREEVDEFRKELYRREGDLLTYLTTIRLFATQPGGKVRDEWCKKRRINSKLLYQALKIRRQLRSLCVKEKLLAEEAAAIDPNASFKPTPPERAELLLKAFLTGFATKTAVLAPDGSYVTSVGKQTVAIHPSSVLHGRKKEAIMYLEHVFTQKSYAKKVSVVQAQWIVEVLGG